MNEPTPTQENNLPTTSELFQKHFGNTGAVGIFHPNIESFFDELNKVCKKEDELKNKTLNELLP